MARDVLSQQCWQACQQHHASFLTFFSPFSGAVKGLHETCSWWPLSRYSEVVFQQCEVRLEVLFLFFFLVDYSFYLKGLYIAQWFGFLKEIVPQPMHNSRF